MNSDRWQRIEEVFRAAQECPAAERSAFLAHACQGDDGLRLEVESLLAQPASAAGFLGERALAAGAEPAAVPTGVAMVGRRLGDYQLQSLLGAGGMGEVYRAHDTRLGRDVALKILPQAVSRDPDRLARFEREARVLAALNHPQIAAIYGVERSAGVEALVLELVEGQTLAQRIARRPMAFEDALPIARQIAEAIVAAHQKGIVHRDLKPANVKIAPDGRVKVLDFGLAKVLDADYEPHPSNSPELNVPASQAGMLVGTAAYMSPEQAKGLPADSGSDLWAFGCVLFEMLTGRPAFDGDTLEDTLASVLKREPDWTAWPDDAPPAIRRLIERSLAKDRQHRLADMSVVRYLLTESASLDAVSSTSGTAAGRDRPRRLWRRALPFAATIILGAIGAAIITWLVTRPAAAGPRVSRTTIVATGAATPTISLDGEALTITPDGSRIVYVGNNGTQLFVRAINALEPVAIATGVPSGPFVSPDDQWVGFIDNGITLKKVPISGGPVVTLATLDSGVISGVWTPDDSIILGTGRTGLLRVSSAGGTPEALTQLDTGESSHDWPQLLPGGRAVLFTIAPRSGGVDSNSIAVLDLRSGTQRVVLRRGSHAYYADSGHLVYSWEGMLCAVAFDLSRMETQGRSVPVGPQLVSARGVAPRDFALAADGTLVYVAPGSAAGAARVLVWVDRSGKEEAIAAPPRAYVYPRLSPDGTRLAVSTTDRDNDIWIWDWQGARFTQLTFDPSRDANPVWTPDGRRIIFSSDRAGAGSGTSLWWQAADGSGSAERLTASENSQLPTEITHDGQQALFNERTPTNGRDLMRVALDGTGRVAPILQSTGEERGARISPDGHWLAYESDRAGRFEVYIRRFPSDDQGPRQASTAGGTRPVWSRRGDELFFLAVDGSLMRVPIEVSKEGQDVTSKKLSLLAGQPTKLMDARYFTDAISATYDVSPDGQRFLMIKAATDTAPETPQIIVVQHFTEELKAHVTAESTR